MTTRERNYGIDSLRIVSMFMIVMLHVLGAGGILARSPWGTGNYFAAWGAENLILCAVNCYALISGFVGVYSKARLKNIVSLWFQVEFYSLGIAILLYFLFPGLFGLSDILKSGLPVLFERYWYFTAYFGMFFFMPYMNRFVLEASGDMQSKFLAVSFVLFSVMPTVVHLDVFHTLNGYSALWLALMYVLGAYIRHHGVWQGRGNVFYLGLFLAAVACNILVKFGMTFFWMNRTGSDNIHSNILMEYTAPTVVVASVMLLIVFSRIRWGRLGVALVRFLAPLTFGVYLIHMQPMVWQLLGDAPFKWIVELPVYKSSLMFMALICVIYMGCSVVEFVRKMLFKVLHMASLESWLAEMIGRLCNSGLDFFRK